MQSQQLCRSARFSRKSSSRERNIEITQPSRCRKPQTSGNDSEKGPASARLQIIDSADLQSSGEAQLLHVIDSAECRVLARRKGATDFLLGTSVMRGLTTVAGEDSLSHAIFAHHSPTLPQRCSLKHLCDCSSACPPDSNSSSMSPRKKQRHPAQRSYFRTSGNGCRSCRVPRG